MTGTRSLSEIIHRLRWTRISTLKYSDVLSSFFETIPEAKAAYDKWDMPGEPLPYIVFSFLEESFLTPIVKSGEDVELKDRIFQFLERMAGSDSSEVVDLLWLSLFEAWAANGTLSLALEEFEPRSQSLARKALKEFLTPRRILS